MDTHTARKTPWIHYETLIVFTLPKTLFWPSEEDRRLLTKYISCMPPIFLKSSLLQQKTEVE